MLQKSEHCFAFTFHIPFNRTRHKNTHSLTQSEMLHEKGWKKIWVECSRCNACIWTENYLFKMWIHFNLIAISMRSSNFTAISLASGISMVLCSANNVCSMQIPSAHANLSMGAFQPLFIVWVCALWRYQNSWHSLCVCNIKRGKMRIVQTLYACWENWLLHCYNLWRPSVYHHWVGLAECAEHIYT